MDVSIENKNIPFHEVLRNIILQYGKELLESTLLVNYLSDFLAFSDKATKRVMSTILQLGYGKKILLLDNSSERLKLIKIKTFAQLLTKEGFQSAPVNYVLDSICYALGWINLSLEGQRINLENKTSENDFKIDIQSLNCPDNVNDSVRTTFYLIKNGDIYATVIAKKRKLTVRTIANHINILKQNGVIIHCEHTLSDGKMPIKQSIYHISHEDKKKRKSNKKGTRDAINTKPSPQKVSKRNERKLKEKKLIQKFGKSTLGTYGLIVNQMCLDLDLLAAKRNLGKQTIKEQVVTLIEEGLVNALMFVPGKSYMTIRNTYNRTNDNSRESLYKQLNGIIEIDIIDLCIAQIKKSIANSIFEKNKFNFVDNVTIILESIEFSQECFKVALTQDGCYLNICRRYLKLCDNISTNLIDNNGSINVDLSSNHHDGYEIIYENSNKHIIIGEIWRNGNRIYFESYNKQHKLYLKI